MAVGFASMLPMLSSFTLGFHVYVCIAVWDSSSLCPVARRALIAPPICVCSDLFLSDVLSLAAWNESRVLDCSVWLVGVQCAV